jgi:hypothetical protein
MGSFLRNQTLEVVVLTFAVSDSLQFLQLGINNNNIIGGEELITIQTDSIEESNSSTRIRPSLTYLSTNELPYCSIGYRSQDTSLMTSHLSNSVVIGRWAVYTSTYRPAFSIVGQAPRILFYFGIL